MHLIILILLGALVTGWIMNTRLRTVQSPKSQGVGIEAMVSPLLALTALLLAFVLVQVFSSYNRAKVSAGDEAGQTMGEYRLFQYLNDEHTPAGQSALLCYARAVINLEWPAMAKSASATVQEVTHWGKALDAVMIDLASSHPGQPYGSIISADRARMDARRRRVTESQSAVPLPVTWLMLGVSAAAIFSISLLVQPSVPRLIRIYALTLLMLVFTAMQVAILDIDSKYNGWITVKPTDMELVRGIIEQVYAQQHSNYPVPCDITGRPL